MSERFKLKGLSLKVDFDELDTKSLKKAKSLLDDLELKVGK